MGNYKLEIEGRFALFYRDDTLVAKIDLGTIEVATVDFIVGQPPFNFPSKRSRELNILAGGIKFRMVVTDDPPPEEPYAHSAYGMVATIHKNMP